MPYVLCNAVLLCVCSDPLPSPSVCDDVMCVMCDDVICVCCAVCVCSDPPGFLYAMYVVCYGPPPLCAPAVPACDAPPPSLVVRACVPAL